MNNSKVKNLEISPEHQEFAHQIADIYSRFGVKIGALIGVDQGPRVTRYEFEITPDTKVNKITMLRDDLSLMLSVPKVRIICPVPNKMAFSIEVQSKAESFVEFDEIVESEVFKASADKLCLPLGKDLANNAVCLELSRAPHLLIGGQTCSGKTNLLRTIILGLIHNTRPDEVKLQLFAPQKEEFKVFENSKHLLTPIISDKANAIEAFKKLCDEMNRRLKMFEESSVKNIDAYNEKNDKKLHRIVAVVDEFSFLTDYALWDFESAVSQLAQKGRPTGIHMVLSTKELTPKNVTGIIKACIPARIALSTQTANESRTIMDGCDAECLLLKGDLLLCNSIIHKPLRIQAPYLPENKILKFLTKQ